MFKQDVKTPESSKKTKKVSRGKLWISYLYVIWAIMFCTISSQGFIARDKPASFSKNTQKYSKLINYKSKSRLINQMTSSNSNISFKSPKLKKNTTQVVKVKNNIS